MRSLFLIFALDLPHDLMEPDLTALDPNDAVPSGIDEQSLAYISENSFFFALV